MINITIFRFLYWKIFLLNISKFYIDIYKNLDAIRRNWIYPDNSDNPDISGYIWMHPDIFGCILNRFSPT